MFTNRAIGILVLGVLGVGAIIVTACAPDSPANLTETVEVARVPENQPEPSSTGTEEASPNVATIPADSLSINEDLSRYATFNINTLAYELPGMDEVEVFNYTYAFHGDRTLTMDVYYPPDTPPEAQLPVVVFGLGYRISRQPLRNQHFYTSWGRLVAAAGLAGIVYDTEQPDQDLEILMGFIKENSDALRIDPTRIGIMSSSANVPTVMSFLMQERKEEIKFGIYYFGLSLTPDHKYLEEFALNCARRGCLVSELADVSYVDPELPLFIVIAGQDNSPYINEGMDHFVDFVQSEGASVTLIEYEEGVHGFDTQQKTEESANIIAQTIEFMRVNFGIE